MAKASETRAFRTVDVDLYNEDNYKEEADTEDSTEALDFNELNSLLNSKNYSTYLQKCFTTSRCKYTAILVSTLLTKSWESAKSYFTHSWESKL